MIVTINTDASYSKKYQVGSYAFWIVCDEFRLKKSGMLKEKAPRPEIAEFRSVMNALHTLFAKKVSVKITRIIVNTDCLNVIHLLENNKAAIREYNLNS